ncbi:MAG: hypothetical protein JWP04_3029 [Belnapia sp.]|nr:hypothetical protein [Belnapia sp.]
MRLALLPALVGCAALALAGCARGPAGCGPAEAQVANASAMAVEQFYLAPMGEAWGADRFDQAGLAAGASRPVRLAGGAGPLAMRVVWADGRAAELPGIDGCTSRRLLILDGGLRAE